jgi:SAM-dependent methyltransferase
LQRLALGLLDPVHRVALWPFRRPRRARAADTTADPSSRADDYNAAAERYFAGQTDSAYLLGKPFSDPDNAARHLIDAGVLMRALRLRPGDVVADIGAGTCWLSHMLNRFGCRTIALDVSSTALALGRELFEADPRTNWALEPEFVAYDGYTIPLPACTCDRIVINDAFHHIPNRRALLAEMFRILREDGVMAMSEPGPGHALVAPSRAEAELGVLETDVIVEDVEALARECGFESTRVVAASPSALYEVPAGELGAFMGGRGFAAYWKQFCGSLDRHQYILVYKGDPTPTTARPAVLSASIELVSARGGPVRVRPGEAVRLALLVTNLGSTVWLAGEGPGWTRLGAHLAALGGTAAESDFDWFRAALPSDVPPGARRRIEVTLPAVAQSGRYGMVFDLVIEGQTWFATHGSATLAIDLEVV